MPRDLKTKIKGKNHVKFNSSTNEIGYSFGPGKGFLRKIIKSKNHTGQINKSVRIEITNGCPARDTI